MTFVSAQTVQAVRGVHGEGGAVMSIDQALGFTVNQYLFAHGMTRADLGEVLGVAGSNVSNRLRGKSRWTAADLVVVAERFHIGRLEQLCPDANYALINDFNPAMPKGQDLDDPWYGPASGFRSTLADIEAAMPGILDALA